MKEEEKDSQTEEKREKRKEMCGYTKEEEEERKEIGECLRREKSKGNCKTKEETEKLDYENEGRQLPDVFHILYSYR